MGGPIGPPIKSMISCPTIFLAPQWVRSILTLVSCAACCVCGAHEPVLTEISGVLLQARRPVANAVISGCTDLRSYKSPTCNRPFKTKTDSKGRFTFVQETGYPECTVCPCIPGQPSACDPSWFIWFRADTGKVSVVFNAISMGNGLVSAEFECDIESPITQSNAPRISEIGCQPMKYIESRRPLSSATN